MKFRKLFSSTSSSPSSGMGTTTATISAKQLARYLPERSKGSTADIERSAGSLTADEELVLRESPTIAHVATGSNSSTCLVSAWDAAQELLAVVVHVPTASQSDPRSSSNPIVAVYGQSGVEQFLHVPPAVTKTTIQNQRSNIRLLAFKQNDGLLLAIVGSGRLVAWNLTKRSGTVEYDVELVHGQSSAENVTSSQREFITCIDLPTACRWIFCGTSMGRVLVVDGERGRRSRFVIPCQFHDDADTSSQQKPSEDPGRLSVVSVLMHPHVPDEILVAYVGGIVVAIRLHDQLIIKRFDARQLLDNTQITSMCWKADGTAFALGLSDGRISIWAYHDEKKPWWTFFVDDQVQETGSSKVDLNSKSQTTLYDGIFQLFWSSCTSQEPHSQVSSNSTLFVSGGMPTPSQDTPALHGLQIIDVEDRKRTILSRRFLNTGLKELNQMMPLSSSPWFLMDPKGVSIILADGTIQLYDLSRSGSGFTPVALPASLNLLQAAPVMMMKLSSNLPLYMFNRLALLSPPEQAITPMIRGGIPGNSLQRSTSFSSKRSKDDNDENVNSYDKACTDILITVHSDSLIRFMDASQPILKDLGLEISVAVELLDADFAANSTPPSVTNVHLSFVDGLGAALLVSLSTGTVLVYRFSLDTRTASPPAPQPHVEMEAIHDAAPPGFQLIWRWKAHKQAITHIVTNSSMILLVDASNNFSIVDIISGEIMAKGELPENAQITSCYMTRTFVRRDGDTTSPSKKGVVVREQQRLALFGFSNSSVLGMQLEQGDLNTTSTNPDHITVSTDDLSASLNQTTVLPIRNPSEDADPILEIMVLDCKGQHVDLSAPDLPQFTESESRNDTPTNQLLPHYLLIVSKRSVHLRYFLDNTILFAHDCEKDSPTISKAKVIWSLCKAPAVLLLLESGGVRVLSLLKLRVLLDDPQVFSSCEDVDQILSDGRILCNSMTQGVRFTYVFDGIEKMHGLPESLCSMHDNRRFLSERSRSSDVATSHRSLTNPSTTTAGKWISSVAKTIAQAATNDPWSGRQHPWTSSDEWQQHVKQLNTVLEAYLERLTPQPNPEGKSNTSLTGTTSTAENSAGASSAKPSRSAFGQEAQNLGERGERLQRMEHKFADMAVQSEGFLDAVREYNRRQEEKKWYELW